MVIYWMVLKFKLQIILRWHPCTTFYQSNKNNTPKYGLIIPNMGLSLTIPPNIGDFRLVSSPIKCSRVWCHVARMGSPQASHILRPKPFGFPFLFRSNRNGRIEVGHLNNNLTEPNRTQQEPNRTQPAIVAQQQPRCVLLRHFAVPVAPWLLVFDILCGHQGVNVDEIAQFPRFAWPVMALYIRRMNPKKTGGVTSEGFQTQVNLSTACHSYRWPIFNHIYMRDILQNSPKYSNLPFFKGQISGQFRIPCHGQARRSLRHLDDGRAWCGAGGDLFHPTAPWRSAKVVAICRAQVIDVPNSHWLVDEKRGACLPL